jgi:hypothetical protein
MFVGDVEYIRSFVLLDNPLMEPGITDDTEIPTERIQEMHEILDNGFAYEVEPGFHYECDFPGIFMADEFFGGFVGIHQRILAKLRG